MMIRVMKNSLIGIFLLGSLVGFGQSKPVAQPDRDSILIGEQVQLTLSIPYDISQPHNIEWPKIGNKIGKNIEVLKVSPIDTTVVNKDEDPNIFVQSRQLVLTSFDSGYFAIPPFNFKLNSKVLSTQALLLKVGVPQVDMLEDFKPVKPIIEIEMTFADYVKAYWKWLALLVALVVLGWLLKRYLDKRKAMAGLTPEPKEKIPPYEKAITQLSALKDKSLYQQGMVKEHYVQLTDILRDYIENQFDIQATDETTDEIINELRRINVHKKDRAKLSKVLRLADFVKFAKAKPTVIDTENALKNSFEFVERTKPKEEEESDEKE